jgi:hypothetical protein
MDIKEFRELGYLQEANRLFFHPRGLALEIHVDNDGDETLGRIWDYRDDPEGMVFNDLSGAECFEKQYNVEKEHMKHKYNRLEKFGFITQPLGNKVDTNE